MEYEALRHKIEKIILGNKVQGYSKSYNYHFTYIKPSANFYPFQFFWDTCFHVFILVALNKLELAKKNMESLFAMQDKDGFVGHILYWNSIFPSRITDIFQSRPGLNKYLFRSHMSNLIQPPLAAHATLRIYEASGDKEFLKRMLPKLKKYYSWLINFRDFDNDHLITSISYFESGMDWKPSYDQLLGFPEQKANWKLFWKVVYNDFLNFRADYDLNKIKKKNHFLCKDAGINTLYARNLHALSKICKVVDDPDHHFYYKQSVKVTDSILKLMYNEQDCAFYDIQGGTNKHLNVITPTILYPIILDSIPKSIKDEIVKQHFFDQETFYTRYPIPSVAVNSTAFNPNEKLYIWRGGTWIVHNWVMHQFLLEENYYKEAQRLITSILQLIRKSGFREYYNPLTGEGYGAKDFTWSGLVLDMIQLQEGITPKESRFI